MPRLCLSSTPRGENQLEEFMRNHFSKAFAGALAVACLAGVVFAQAPAAGAQAGPTTPVEIVVANPTYASIVMEVNVNRPAAEVWKRVGKYCDIGEWLRLAGTITSGKDGERGARGLASK